MPDTSLPHQRCLLIDIDDTLLSQRPAWYEDHGHALLALIRRAATHKGISDEQVDRVFIEVMRGVWWRWQDFLDALQIERSWFWDWAEAIEKQRSTPTAPLLPGLLEQLHDAGYALRITSNNPTDGVAHKLRLVGVDDVTQARLLDAVHGTNNTRANKSQPAFWRAVIEQIDLDPDRLTVIGNDAHDDDAAPRAAGITHTLVLQASRPPAQEWERIAHTLLGRSVAMSAET